MNANFTNELYESSNYLQEAVNLHEFCHNFEPTLNE